MIESKDMKRFAKYLVLLCLLIALIAVGLVVYKDYGIPWDEAEQIQIGTLNYKYAIRGDTELLTFRDRYYGALFESSLLWLNAHLPIPRHLLIFFTFVIGLVLFFLLSKRLFKNLWWALLATAILATSPRIFADAFYNSKDIPFMVASIAAIWTLVLLADILRQKRGWLLIGAMTGVHAAASAVLIGTRIPGIMIIPLSIFLILIGIMEMPFSWKRRLGIVSGYFLLTVCFTILCWPILWHDPWAEFVNAFLNMSKYPFNRPALYMGQFYTPNNLPWHYLPVWIGITTPIIVLLGFVPGVAAWVKSLYCSIGGLKRAKDENPAKRLFDPDLWVWVIIFGWIVIPLVAVYWFHSILYDGWRQMFFIYPAIVLISMRGLKSMFDWLSRLLASTPWARLVAGLILLAGLAEPIWFIFRYHPYENVYFNVLAGSPSTLRQRFELDYWGLSYKQAIDFILANDPGQEIKIVTANPPGQDYINSGLSAAQKSRITYINDLDEADYFVTEFRWHPDDYPYPDEFYSITVRGTKIMAVYRIH